MNLKVTFILAILGVIIPSAILQTAEKTRNRWRLFEYGDQTNMLYEHNNISQFLGLCGKLGSEVCPAVEDKINCIEDCNLTTEDARYSRREALQVAKGKVEGFLKHLESIPQTTAMWLIWLTCFAGGAYLMFVGHFNWRNLPLIGDWLLDSSTDGIKFKHYMWMRWVILGDSNIHWLTHLKKGTKIFSWVPLSKQPWDRPQTPTEIRETEPRDQEQPAWTIESIAKEFGLELGDFDDLEEGWEEQVKQKLKKSSAAIPDTDDEVENPDDIAYKVLEEYWVRMFGWPWARYRYKLDPEHMVRKKEAASERTFNIYDDDDDDYN